MNCSSWTQQGDRTGDLISAADDGSGPLGVELAHRLHALFWGRNWLVWIFSSILVLISVSLAAADRTDFRTRGPTSKDLLEALQLDLEQTLPATVVGTMEISWIRDPGDGRVFVGWSQQIQGYPVRGSLGRSLVRLDPVLALWSVGYRSFRFVAPVEVGDPVVGASVAAATARRDHPARTWSQSNLEIVGGRDGEPRLCWVITGSSNLPGLHSSLRIDVDAMTGRILGVEEQVCEIDIPGTLSAVRTPGTGPQGTISGELFTLGGAEVSGAGATTHSDPDGDFLLLRGNSTNFTVLAGLQGVWGSVISSIAPDATASAAADPNGVDLLINGADDPDLTAQTNAFHYVEEGFNYFVASPGGFPAMMTPVNATTGLGGTCNAFYDPSTSMLRFLRSGGGCVDSAYSSVILHEFGHHVVASLGLVQGVFGEGYGDSLAIVFLSEGIIGRDFGGPGQHVRDVEGAGVQVPCSGGIHFCGQALAGFWFDLGTFIDDQYGAAIGDEVMRDLFVDWSSITSGALGSQPIHDNTITEILTIDDDDGDLSNGTPNWNQICAAAAARGLGCPVLITLTLTLEQGPGELIPPDVPSPVRVTFEELLAGPAAGGSRVLWRTATGAWQSFLLFETSAGVLEGTFPALQCLDQVEWYVEVEDDLGFITTIPESALVAPFSTISANEANTILQESMATDPGWSTSDATDAALFGLWEWGVPIGSNAQASAGVPAPSGDQSCYVTGLGSPGDSAGVHDVDYGETTLTSTELTLSPTGTHRISYWRWFSNSTSISIPDDVLTIWKSLDGAATWEVVETVGPGNPQANGGWFQHSFLIDEGESVTDTLMLKFRTGDLGAGSITEAGVDLVEITVITCTGGPSPPPVENDFSRGDCNVDGQRDISDVVQMLEVLFGPQTSFPCADACDFNDGGVVDLTDVIQLLQVLFLGGVASEPICGPDPTSDALGCIQATICP